MIQVVVKPGMRQANYVVRGHEAGTKAPVRSMPLANLLVTESGWLIRLAVPGLNKEAIQINLEKSTLTVEGTYPESTGTEKRVLRQEFGQGILSRSFVLPETAETAGIQAKCEAGILEIRIPKKEAVQIQVL